jgi:hypothetical protein
MTTSIARPCTVEQHPVTHGNNYRLPTPAIEDFYRLIQRCLRFRTPGAIIYGRSRFGKSYAIDYLTTYLRQQKLKTPILKLTCEAKKIPSEIAFFGNLLDAAQHQATTGRDASTLRRRLTSRLREIAERAGSDRLILFADEAQVLRRIEYEWLRDAHNALRQHHIVLIVFLVGQPELRAQKSVFIAERQEQIVARFMVEDLAFRGLLNAQDCATVLEGYDRTQYPPASGWSYTRFFLPKAYDAGLRLAQEGDTLWSLFVEAHRTARLPGDPEIGMEFFAHAAEYALIESTRHDSPTFSFSAALWAQAIEASRYTRAQEITGAMEIP